MLRVTAFADGTWRTIPFEDLQESFLGICEAHRAQGRALAFAFILFDRSHPYVRSTLAHQNYWEALDERSGHYLSVFSIDVRRQPPESPLELRRMFSMVAPSHDQIGSALSKYFEGFVALTLPCVLFFQVADGQVVDTAVVALAATGLSETYDELEEIIGTAADAVSRVEDENAGNAQAIFNLITTSLQERQRAVGRMKLYRATRPLVEIAGALQFLQWLVRLVGQ